MAVHALSEYLENKILSADRVELVQIQYQAAVESVENARRYLKERNIPARVHAINKAIAILGSLTASLNREAGGDLSRTLRALYDYMMRRLIEANFQQSDPPLAEVSKLLATVLVGWMGCKSSNASAAAGVSPASPALKPAVATQEHSTYAPPAHTRSPYFSPEYASEGSEPRFALSY
jgi:flagellar protein FliS